MYLTITNLTPYLLARGLVSADTAMRGDLTIIDAGRRNRNFKVITGEHQGLFVKQIKTTSPDAIMTLEREAKFYRLLRSRPELEPLARMIPRFVDYNPANYTLVLELFPHAENLAEHQYRLGDFPERLGEIMGRSLAECHNQTRHFLTDPNVLSLLPRHVPWVFTTDPPYFPPLNQLGTPGTQLIALLQQHPDVVQLLQGMRHEWRFDSLLHGDLKWDNYLVFNDQDGAQDFRVVDWELADFGDASWDVGAVFGTYLVHWVVTHPLTAGLTTEMLFADASPKLVAMKPSMRRFWQSYVAARGLPAWAVDAYLERCLRFCAARLVVAVFEYLANWGQMTTHAVAMFQLGQRILHHPRRAAADLVGP